MVYAVDGNGQNYLRGMWEHMHSAQLVFPTDTSTILLTSGGGPNTLGAFSADIIASGELALPYDLHWVDIGIPNTNANYTIVFYAGPADVEMSRVCFQRFNATNISTTKPLKSDPVTPGYRLRAKMMDSIGGSTCEIKIYAHTYELLV
jgi:hypothetical protein